jgi:hypothetical protein
MAKTYKTFTVVALEAEKLQKTEWLQFWWTPCINMVKKLPGFLGTFYQPMRALDYRHVTCINQSQVFLGDPRLAWIKIN